MEAGNRCFDDRVPEEVNRRVIDHSSDVLMPYTDRSRENLLREGIQPSRILRHRQPDQGGASTHHAERIDASGALGDLGVEPGEYLLLTVHRQETVDVERAPPIACSQGAVEGAEGARHAAGLQRPPAHRAAASTRSGSTSTSDVVRPYEPFGFFDFVALERNARCVLTDSGTVQEECCIMGVPTVTVRDTTERPETVECGSNMLSGVEPEGIRRCLDLMLDESRGWEPPPEYLVDDVSATVANIVL